MNRKVRSLGVLLAAAVSVFYPAVASAQDRDDERRPQVQRYERDGEYRQFRQDDDRRFRQDGYGRFQRDDDQRFRQDPFREDNDGRFQRNDERRVRQDDRRDEGYRARERD